MKKSILRNIDPKRRYQVHEIVSRKFICSRNGNSNRFLVYRLIKNRVLPARKSVFGKIEVLGRDLREFVETYYHA